MEESESEPDLCVLELGGGSVDGLFRHRRSQLLLAERESRRLRCHIGTALRAVVKERHGDSRQQCEKPQCDYGVYDDGIHGKPPIATAQHWHTQDVA